MTASNFPESALKGESTEYQTAVNTLHERFNFDFTSMGLTAFVGAPLKWIYSAGATSERHRRIALAPGHGIGGIVIKAGKPMLFADIDSEIDPREYSSYPIVFAEDLRSFCALPLKREDRVVAVLLCAHRNVSDANVESYNRVIEQLDGDFCGMEVVSDDFMELETEKRSQEDSPKFDTLSQDGATFPITLTSSNMSKIIEGQELERQRISRELHDGIAQELLSVSLTLSGLDANTDASGKKTLNEVKQNINAILDELHNISVMLRPSALDHMGFIPALRSQALVLEGAYGTCTQFEGDLKLERFDKSLETQAYRICQEAMTNACKYSGCDTVRVVVERRLNWLHISVIDNGAGFDVHHPSIKGSGCGLLGMKERAALVGATLTIESGADGTNVSLVTPMHFTRAGSAGLKARK